MQPFFSTKCTHDFLLQLVQVGVAHHGLCCLVDLECLCPVSGLDAMSPCRACSAQPLFSKRPWRTDSIAPDSSILAAVQGTAHPLWAACRYQPSKAALMADEEARDLPIFDAAIIAGRTDHHTSIHGSSEYFV